LQSISQDFVDLIVIVPCLIATSFYSFYSRTAFLLWGGIVFYLTYTFAIYSFDVHFNRLFIVYCISAGLSFYSSIYFVLTAFKEKVNGFSKRKRATSFTGVYFLAVSVFFYVLWLIDIVAAISNDTLPKDLSDSGLPTNPVQVIDLAVFLPAVFITGILILKRKDVGLVIAPAVLTFFILMNITIGSIAVVMKLASLPADFSITIIMAMMTLFSLAVLIWYLKSIKIHYVDQR
jgi:hypothetical protein